MTSAFICVFIFLVPSELTEKTILDSKYKAMLLLPLFSAQSHGVCFCAFSENNGASRRTNNCNKTFTAYVFSVARTKTLLPDDHYCWTFTLYFQCSFCTRNCDRNCHFFNLYFKDHLTSTHLRRPEEAA